MFPWAASLMWVLGALSRLQRKNHWYVAYFILYHREFALLSSRQLWRNCKNTSHLLSVKEVTSNFCVNIQKVNQVVSSLVNSSWGVPRAGATTQLHWTVTGICYYSRIRQLFSFITTSNFSSRLFFIIPALKTIQAYAKHVYLEKVGEYVFSRSKKREICEHGSWLDSGAFCPRGGASLWLHTPPISPEYPNPGPTCSS